MKKYLIVLILITIFASCAKDEVITKSLTPSIFGTWVEVDGSSNRIVKVFAKKDTFDEYKFGYSFKENNDCTIRIKVKCGENPIFENVQANYSLVGDTLINIKYFYNRKTEYSLQITSLTLDSLFVITK